MKKLTVLFVLIFSVLLWSCGGGSEKSETSEKPAEKKKISLKTQEGMMAKLGEFKINIPENLKFIEVKKESGTYTAHFVAENLDETNAKTLTDWFDKQKADLAAAGWKQRDIRVNEEMMGSVYNQSIFIKPKGGGSTLSHTLDFSSEYDSKGKIYKLYISPDDH